MPPKDLIPVVCMTFGAGPGQVQLQLVKPQKRIKESRTSSKCDQMGASTYYSYPQRSATKGLTLVLNASPKGHHLARKEGLGGEMGILFCDITDITSLGATMLGNMPKAGEPDRFDGLLGSSAILT